MVDILLRPDWLDLVQEEIVDPDRRIVDPHHHFYPESSAFPAYSPDDLRQHASKHNVEQTVYVQCLEGYREDGPEHLRCVGETEMIDGFAKAGERKGRPLIGAIVSDADLIPGSTYSWLTLAA